MSFIDEMKKVQLDLNQFYTMGKIIFGIIALASLYTLLHNWAILDLGSKVSGIFGIIFDIVLVLFFNYLHRNMPPQMPKQESDAPSEEDMAELMERLK